MFFLPRNSYTFPMVCQLAMLLTNGSDSRALWKGIAPGAPNIPPKGQLNGSTTINVMYDSVNDSDPDCCEWHFLSPALPFFKRVRGGGGHRQGHNSDSFFRGPCHRRTAAAVRQSQDHRIKNPVAMSLRPPPPPPPPSQMI